MTAKKFPVVMTPVKLIVNGSVPPLDKLAVMLPFAPVTEPVAVFVKESAEQVSPDGHDTTKTSMLVGTLADPVIEPSLFCVKLTVKAEITLAE